MIRTRRLLKKCLDYWSKVFWCNPGETVRHTMHTACLAWCRRKHLDQYIDHYIKDPDTPSENGRYWKET